MRGGYVHNCVLLAPIEQKARRRGVAVDREAAIRVGDRVLYGDLLIRDGSRRILVEAELSSRRVPNDLAKAAALEACDLWVVVPNSRVSGSVHRKLAQHGIRSGPGLFVLSLPQALQRLEEMIELNSRSNGKMGTENKAR